MFTINSSLGFTLYLSIFLIGLLALWIFDNKKRMKKDKLAPLTRLYTCEYCHFPYLDETSKKVTACPQCKSYNKNNAYHQ